MLQRVVVQRDNENNIIKDLLRKTNLSEKFHDPIPKRLIQKPKLPELCSTFPTHCLNMIQPSVKFYEYIQYGLGVGSQT